MNKLLKTLLEEFNSKISTFEFGIKRDVILPDILNKIMVIIGMRRSGKTYFMLQTIFTLLKQIPISRILYINFEDERLYSIDQHKLAELVDGFYSLYPENHEQLCYLFFDEIQNVNDWALVIRRYFDSKKVKIFLTGSSAKLLSKEIATSLRGRSITIEIWPFSFLEFLRAKNLLFSNYSNMGKATLDKLTAQLINYLGSGGFPEIINLATADRVQILQDYVAVVVLRDIIERYKITNIALIRYIIKTLIKNVGSAFSINKLFNDLKSQNFAVSKMTIHNYLIYMEDSYLVFTVPIYAESLRKVQSNPRKIYAVDPGIVRSYTLGINHNLGHYFENLIYLDLRRKKHTIYYYLTKNRREVDFLSCDLEGNWHLYQVCFDMDNPETRHREMLALQEAEDELGIKGQCITPEEYLRFLR